MPTQSLPTPLSNFAPRLLPASVHLARADIGIADDELLHAVLAVLSRNMVYSSRGVSKTRNRPGCSFATLGLALEEYARTPLGDSPAPLGAQFAPTRRPPQRKQQADLFKRADQTNISPADLKRFYNDEKLLLTAKHRGARYAFPVVPAELLDIALPHEFWPAVGALILDGPAMAHLRLSAAVAARAERRKPDGTGYKLGSMVQLLLVTKRLFSDLVALVHHPSGLLQGWHTPPDTVLLPQNLDTAPTKQGAPSYLDIRRTEAHIRAEVRLRLELDSAVVLPGDELRAVEAMAARGHSILGAAGLFHPLKAWAAWQVMTRTGQRPDSMVRLKNRDWVIDTTSTGRTLVTRPGKDHPDEYESPKPMNGDVGYPIDVFRTYLRLMHGRLEDDWPLLPSTLASPERHWQSLDTWVSGAASRVEKRLVPQLEAAMRREGRTEGWFELLRPGNRANRMVFILPDGQQGMMPSLVPYTASNPFHGWTPQTYRAACARMLETPLTADWLRANGVVDAPQRFLSEVLEDRFFPGEVRAAEKTYKLTPEMQKYLRGVSSQVLQAVFGTDYGARRAPDVERYEHALHAYEEGMVLTQELRARRAQLRDQLRVEKGAANRLLAAIDEVSEQTNDLAASLKSLKTDIEAMERGELLRTYPDDRPVVPTPADMSAVRASVLREYQRVLATQRVASNDAGRAAEIAGPATELAA